MSKTIRPKILLCEDDVNLGYLIEHVLSKEGYLVRRVKTGRAALQEIQKNIYSIHLIDIGLPDISGFSLVDFIRKTNTDIPIIIITDQLEQINEVESFKRKATLFHKKPINFNLLAIQINNYLKQDVLNTIYSIGNLQVEEKNQTINVGDLFINLSRSEYNLLMIFLRSGTRTFARNEIMDRIMNRSKLLSDNAIDTLVSRVRKKLTFLGYPDLIVTVHNIGYKLNPLYSIDTVSGRGT